MKSIYEKALGEQFNNLHKEMQKKYGLKSEQNLMALGQGRMTEIRGTSPLLRPFLQFGIKNHLIFAERGKNIPFTLENYAYIDEEGRETLSWIHRFFFPYAIRGMDTAMHFDESKQKIVDVLGKSGLMQMELDLHVTSEGGLYMESNELCLPGCVVPGSKVSIYEHFDDKEDAFHVHVHISHFLFGTLLMYEGVVHTEFIPMTYNNIPDRGFLE